MTTQAGLAMLDLIGNTEKVLHLKALGAEVRTTRSDVGKGHPAYYQDYAARLVKEIPGAWFADQFNNPENSLAHERTTGPEIWEQMHRDVDAIVVGVGSSGTLTGLTRYFRRVRRIHRADGMLVDKSDLNFGKRSWRYSMLVRNKKIEKMFIEPQKEGDPFEVSDADTMLDYLDPKARRPAQVALLSRIGCPHCAKAKRLLTEAGYEYVDVPLGHTVRTKAVGAISGGKTVPQVFINGKLIGGAEDLENYLRKAA